MTTLRTLTPLDPDLSQLGDGVFVAFDETPVGATPPVIPPIPGLVRFSGGLRKIAAESDGSTNICPPINPTGACPHFPPNGKVAMTVWATPIQLVANGGQLFDHEQDALDAIDATLPANRPTGYWLISADNGKFVLIDVGANPTPLFP